MSFPRCYYIIPGSGSTLTPMEWGLLGVWSALGVVFYIVCKRKYGEKFGSLAEIISDKDAFALQASNEELDLALDQAIDEAINYVIERETTGSLL